MAQLPKIPGCTTLTAEPFYIRYTIYLVHSWNWEPEIAILGITLLCLQLTTIHISQICSYIAEYVGANHPRNCHLPGCHASINRM